MEINKNPTPNKTSVALGMFDGVHIGHVEVIQSALERKQFSPAVFTFRVLKKPGGSIIPYRMKFDILKSKGISTIYSSDFDSVRDLSAEEFVKEILIDRMNCACVSCGEDFRFSRNADADSADLKRICESHGIEVNVLKHVELNGVPISSTRIREAIKNGDIELANKMLGYDLTYDLEVIEGEKLGRTIGAPTINQVIPADCVLPKFGVYKSRVLIDVINYTAVTNIGVRPTVTSKNGENIESLPSVTVETHIPGFNMEIYGQSVQVSLQKYIRGEKKFASLDELKSQIQEDIAMSTRF